MFISYDIVWLYYVALQGMILIFFFSMPLSIGCLSNLLIPLCFHLADMCLPRTNYVSFWLLFFSFIFSLSTSFFYYSGPLSV